LASQINASNSGFGGIVSTGDSSGQLQLQTAGTTAVTIDTSQNVGIGTASPAYKLDVVGSLNVTADSFYRIGSGTDRFITYRTGNSDILYSFASGFFYRQDIGGSTHSWWTSNTERMRIASNGDVLIGQTTNPATSALTLKVQTLVANGVNAQITSNTGTSYPWSNYNATGTYVGGITCTSSASAFPTSSDKRLKKNIEDAPSAIDKILTAQVVSHDWIDDNAHVEYGFVAQDLQSIIPQAVVEGTDKEDGSINMPWGVDYSKIVPLLTKAIQEQQTIINDLKARIETLEAK
jgi:hypothetical protein